MSAYKGYIPTVSTNSAVGIWTLRDQIKYRIKGSWPTPPPHEYISQSFAQVTTSGTVITINKPASVIENDLLVASVCRADASGVDSIWSDPGGWTEIYDNGSNALYTKIAGPSEPTSYTFSQTASRTMIGIIYCYRYAVFDSYYLDEISTSGVLTSAPLNFFSSGATVVAPIFQIYYTGQTWTNSLSWPILKESSVTAAPSMYHIYGSRLEPSSTTITITNTTGRNFRIKFFSIKDRG